MANESDDIPAGWYPAPNGGKRYWDGHRWLALPEPDDDTADDDTSAALLDRSNELAAYHRKTLVIAAVSAAVLAAMVAGGLIWKNQRDTQMRNDAAAAAVAAAEQQATIARAKRAQGVKEIEASVMTMAKKHVADGVIDGPVLSVSCVPVDGGSTEDLTERTTVFECFVAEKDNGDGTMTGMKYNATKNWTTGEYTYGYGAPR
jgi:hypothetical protein